MLKNLLLISSIALFLSACGSIEKLKVFSKPVENKIIAPSDPKPLLLDKLHFDVVNKDNIEQYLSEVKKQQNTDEFVFYAMTPKNYELLALNMREVKRFIIQQKEIIIFYKEATQPKKEGNLNKKEK